MDISQTLNLFVRSLRNDESHTCPVESLAQNASEPIIGNMTFYTFSIILAGACTAFTCLLTLILMSIHATHLSKSNEQIKIMRIALIIPAWTVLPLICIAFPSSQVYLQPWLDFIQSIAFGNFFLLLCEFVSPSPSHRDVFFAGMTVARNGDQPPEHGLVMYKRMWFSIFQYPVVSFLVAVVTDITEAAGVYCQYETKAYFAKIWLRVIGIISLSIAIMALLRFFSLLRPYLKGHKPIAKFVAFKVVVFLTFVESILFLILDSTGALQTTAKLTWADLHIGVPHLLVCLELVPISFLFFYAYHWSPYIIGSSKMLQPIASEQGSPYQPMSYTGGPVGIWAWIQTFNPSDIIEAIIFGFKMQSEIRRSNAAYGGHRSTRNAGLR